MSATVAIRAHGGPLGRWVWGPLAGLAALFALGTQLPTYSCGAGGLGSSGVGIAFEVVGYGGAAVLIGLAIWRAVGQRRLRRGASSARRLRPDRWTVGYGLLGLAVIAFFAVRVHAVAVLAFFGVLILLALLTLCTFLAISVAAINGQDADEVGMLLPIWLAGTAICAYLPAVVWAAALAGGCWAS